VSETLAHLQLKRLAAATLLRWGCQAAAMEVLCPISRFRVDAAGWLDREPVSAGHNHLAAWAGEKAGERAEAGLFDAQAPAGDRRANPVAARVRCEPRTVIIECKQSRADFLRDRDNLDALLKAREAMEERRRRFAEKVRETEPHLQSTSGVLFSELGEWNLDASTNPTYRRILRELEKIDERLHGGTKFHRLTRYRLAERLYLLAPAGVVGRREVPPGWGLVECPKRWGAFRRASLVELSGVEVHIAVEAPRHVSPLRRRERLLRNIAVALTRATVTASIRTPSASSGTASRAPAVPSGVVSRPDSVPELALGVRMESDESPS
jgi:sRNA-binding carbon storage regulator CsrA